MKQDSLLRNRDFVKFWIGEGVSLLGSQITVLALPLTAIIVLNAGAAQVGLIRFLELVPYLLFALIFGVWVDRRRRRPIMVAANVARMLLIGLIPVLAALGLLALPILLAITFGVGAASVLFDVTWMSYVPTLVHDPGSLVEANTKLGATMSAAETAGPGIGGILVSVLTAPIAMAADALSYLVSLISLLLIQLPEAPPAPPQAKRSMGAELAEGMRWVFGNRYLRVLAAMGGACNFFVTAITTVFVLYAVRAEGIRPGILGFILSAGAAGGIIGAVLTARLMRRLRVGRTYTLSLGTALLAPLIIPFAHGPEPVLAALFASSFFLIYVGMSIANVVAMSLRQIVTPARLMGRMNAAMRMTMYGAAALGGPFSGLIGSLAGLRVALWSSAICAAFALIPLVLSPVGRLREMPPAAGELSGAATVGADQAH